MNKITKLRLQYRRASSEEEKKRLVSKANILKKWNISDKETISTMVMDHYRNHLKKNKDNTYERARSVFKDNIN